MTKHDKSESWQADLDKLCKDERYEPFRPLLDFMKTLSGPAEARDEKNQDLAKGLLAVVEELQGQRKKGIDISTQIQNMAEGYVQPDWTLLGDVQQANRDFVINKIKVVFQQYGGGLLEGGAAAAKAVDPQKQADAERRYRQRMKENLSSKTKYYVELSGETFQPEYCAWFQEEQEKKLIKLETLRKGINNYPCVILPGDPGCGKKCSGCSAAGPIAKTSTMLGALAASGSSRATCAAASDFGWWSRSSDR